MARPSKLTDAQWERLNKAELAKVSTILSSCSDSEKTAGHLVNMFLMFGHAEKALGVPAIQRYRREFPLPKARIDFLLTHRDGGVTILELKSRHNQTDLAAGIGQLFLYEALMLATGQVAPKYVRKVLAAQMSNEDGAIIQSACEAAGVAFVRLPTHEQLLASIEAHGYGT